MIDLRMIFLEAVILHLKVRKNTTLQLLLPSLNPALLIKLIKFFTSGHSLSSFCLLLLLDSSLEYVLMLNVQRGSVWYEKL